MGQVWKAEDHFLTDVCHIGKREKRPEFTRYHADLSEWESFSSALKNITPSHFLQERSKYGYTIKDPQRGFLGTSPEVLLFISFDENGIAIDCEEGYRPGG